MKRRVLVLPVLLALAAPAAAPAAPVIAAAGDIACGPKHPAFNGGAGTARNCAQRRTARLLYGRGYRAILPLGDLQYNRGGLRAFRRVYARTWGRLRAKTRPVPGNHEYLTSGARGYFDYFNGVGRRSGPAGVRGRGWYSYRLGRWHVVAINSICDQVGCRGDSRQLTWLRRNLALHPRRCTLAYFHHPLFSSGDHKGDANVRPIWRALYRAGVDVVLNGHEHGYERFRPQSPRGRRDSRHGITQFTVGTGGHSLFPLHGRHRNTAAQVDDRFGILRLRLGRTRFRWAFVAEGGRRLDSGRHHCHGPLPRYDRSRHLPRR